MLTREEILNKVYNLILDPTLTSEERVILVRFKDRVGESNSFDREVMMLSESLRF
ncbi:bacteriocin immunity protein [Streptococcus equi]|uniref:bacteriocin immunity protein n=1 Tax=Streptococcus equi TaxID=1336 RepID=UPI001E4B10BA|nr:bacteriocin immunity protein [Streptococcus equi]